MSASKFLLAAAFLPVAAYATPTVIIFDNFTSAQFVGVGNGTNTDTLTLANGLSRALTVTGNRASQSSIDIDLGQMAISTPSLGTSTFKVEYTPTSGSFSLSAANNDLSSSALAISVVSADFGSSFTWTITDTSDNVATWFQTYDATGSVVNYSKAFADFSNGAGINWSAVKKITFDANGVANLDAVFGTGFGVAYANNPIPEPSTYGLVLGGLALVGAAVRRRRQAK